MFTTVTPTCIPIEKESAEAAEATCCSAMTTSSCCVPAPPGGGNERGEPARDHDEARKRQGREHAERGEHRVGDGEPAAPGARLERDDAAQVPAGCGQDGRTLPDVRPQAWCGGAEGDEDRDRCDRGGGGRSRRVRERRHEPERPRGRHERSADERVEEQATPLDAPIPATVVPRTRSRSSAIFSASPPRAGT